MYKAGKNVAEGGRDKIFFQETRSEGITSTPSSSLGYFFFYNVEPQAVDVFTYCSSSKYLTVANIGIFNIYYLEKKQQKNE